MEYEDLVENDLNVARMLYNFTGVSIDDSIVDHIKKLSNGISMKIKSFGIETSFKHDHWKKEMMVNTIRDVEKSCGSFKEKLKYSKFKKRK